VSTATQPATVVLAYSGGLDTSVAIRWLAETKGYDVVACAVDVGQAAEGDLDRIRGRALDCGAAEAVVVDAREEFARDFCFRGLAAEAVYQDRYPLVSALSRPLIAAHLVRVAEERDATAVAHGCTGKGNDQVRFEAAIGALNPELTVEAPIREWGLSREEAVRWGTARDLPLPAASGSPYSIDENLWGRAAECGVLEDPWHAPPEEVYGRTVPVADAPEAPDEVVIGFDRGVPVSLDGRFLSPASLTTELERRAGAHGVGRLDLIEDRLVGIKSREVYEAPAAVPLLAAHRDLSDLTLERDLAKEKHALSARYAELIYNGLWYSPLRQALDAFIAEAERWVSGEVRVRLYKSTATPVGRRAPQPLYDYGLATYDDADAFDHTQARGFVALWSLPTKVWSRRQGSAATNPTGLGEPTRTAST